MCIRDRPYAVYCKTGTAEKYDGNSNVDHPNHLQIGYISATEDSKPLVAFASIAFREDRSSSGDVYKRQALLCCNVFFI